MPPELILKEFVKMMHPYKNLAGNSGIVAYEIGKTFIRIRFKDGIYTYSYKRPGKTAVEAMKAFALNGRGLSTYISRYVKENYATKQEI